MPSHRSRLFIAAIAERRACNWQTSWPTSLPTSWAQQYSAPACRMMLSLHNIHVQGHGRNRHSFGTSPMSTPPPEARGAGRVDHPSKADARNRRRFQMYQRLLQRCERAASTVTPIRRRGCESLSPDSVLLMAARSNADYDKRSRRTRAYRTVAMRDPTVSVPLRRQRTQFGPTMTSLSSANKSSYSALACSRGRRFMVSDD